MDEGAKITRRNALSALSTGAAALLATDSTKSNEQRSDGFTSDEDAMPQFPTMAVAELFNPAVSPPYIRTSGGAAASDGQGGIFAKVAVEPTHDRKFQIANGTWYERSLGEAYFDDDPLATPYAIIKKMRHWITPADYGAVGSLATPDDEAMLRTINAAVRPGWNLPRPIYLEKGDILLTEHNILGQWDSLNRAIYKGVFGLTMFGAGPYASRLVMQQDSNIDDKWFYDGQNAAGTGSANNGLLFPTFRDFTMTRQGVGAAKVHCFRPFAEANGYPSQKFRFFNTRWRDLGTVMHLSGSVNCDSNGFFGTHATQCDTFILCDNAQAVAHNVIGCDFELAFRDIFKFTKGASLNVIGGSYMMHTFARAEHFILNVPSIAGGATGTFVIQGIRTEMNSRYAKILNVSGADNGANYHISDSAFRTNIGGARNSFQIDPQCKAQVVIERNELLNLHQLEWKAASANYEFHSGPYARVIFRDNSGFGRSDVKWGANAIGWTEISGDKLGAMDFSGGGKGKLSSLQSCAANTDRRKVANGWVRYWPCDGNDASVHGEDDFQVIIPVGSIIREIHVEKAAGGSSTTTYQLEVVDADGNVLGQSTSAPQNAKHTISITGQWLIVSTANLGTIRVRPVSGSVGSNVSTEMGARDIFAVEYY